MAKKAPNTGEKPTRKAVLRYAADLRDAASRARAKNPYVELYSPSEDVASRLCSEMIAKHGQETGPQMAMAALAYRAHKRELEIEEDEQRARDARKRHLQAQTVAAGERQAVNDSRSLGQRLDSVLWSLGVLSEAKVSRLDGDVVSGSRGAGAVPFTSDRHERARRDAVALVERLERDAEAFRRRLVEREAA